MRLQLLRLRQHLEPLGIAPAEALALLILLAGALALTGAVWWANGGGAGGDGDGVSGDGSDPVELVAGLDPTPSASGEAPAVAIEDDLVVHVAGQVVRPGVVTLPAGSRVGEAIAAAGGPTAGAVLHALNLARPLADGEQVVVPAPGEEVVQPQAAGTGAGPGPGGADGDGLLDLNAATLEQLLALPGIGPVMGQRIIDHRDAIGGFAAVTQLLEVTGIGPARFADLETRVRV
ncbi:hypothetical protein BH23ACT9_BH23ACT9_09910 [soil metagenome]